MASLKQLFTQSAIYGLSTVVPRLLNYLLVPLHTRVFSDPANYGVITELYAYITFLLILLTFGLETGFFRFASKNKNSTLVYSTIFYFVLLTSCLAGFFFFFQSQNIATFLGTQYKPEYITILGLVVATDAFMAIPFAKLRFDNRPIVFSAIKIIGVSVNVGVNLLIFYLWKHSLCVDIVNSTTLLQLIFLANLVQNLIVLVILLIVTRIPRFKFSFTILKPILRYSLPILVAGMAGTTNEAMDRIFIKYLLPSNYNALYELGIYSSNVKLAVLMVLFIQMYRFAAEPFFFNLHASSEGTTKLFPKTQKFFIVFCILILLAITFNLPILKYIVGAEYRHKLIIVPLLLLSNVLFGTFFNLSFWYKLTDKTAFGIKYTVIGAFTTIILNIILIPLIGIYGAAVTRIICYGLMNLLSYRDGRNSGLIKLDKTNLNYYIVYFIAIIIAGCATFLISPLLSVVIVNIMLLVFVFFFAKKENIVLPFIGRI